MLGHTCRFDGFSADATPLFCASSLSRPWLCLLAVCCRSCEAIVNLASSVRSFVDTTTFLLLNSFVGTAPTQKVRQPLNALCCNPYDEGVIYTVHNGMIMNPNQVRLQNFKRSSQHLQDKRIAAGSHLRWQRLFALCCLHFVRLAFRCLPSLASLGPAEKKKQR